LNRIDKVRLDWVKTYCGLSFCDSSNVAVGLVLKDDVGLLDLEAEVGVLSERGDF
jgi:hypothetical protein